MSAIRLRNVAAGSYRSSLAQRNLITSASAASSVRIAAVSRLNATRALSGTQNALSAVSRLNFARAFSSTPRALGTGQTDVALSQKLQSEIAYEQEEPESSAEPDFIKAFEEQGIWKIEDIRGNDEVTLTRKFGNETLRLMFAVTDLQETDDQEYVGEGEEAEEAMPTYPLRASLAVTKTDTPGALNIDMAVQEGQFEVDNISFYNDKSIGTELTAEADWKRRGLYIGPQFSTLDTTVREEFDKWLRERGVNESVALFIPDYADWKEQKEYEHWLKGVKAFIDA